MKTILFSILILFSINGFAYNWKKVVEGVDVEVPILVEDSIYVDVDNIKKHNGLVYYWELVDLRQPYVGNSLIYKAKADCVEEKLTKLNVTWYSQSMGKGRILFQDMATEDNVPNKIQYPKPTSVRYEVMKFVCNY